MCDPLPTQESLQGKKISSLKQLADALILHYFYWLITDLLACLFVQTYSFDLQRPSPVNRHNEPIGTFEPVYLDDLGACGYI